MTISSRTPEGEPTACPLCQRPVVVEPSVLHGDATCPHCGTLLWVLRTPESTWVFEKPSKSSAREAILRAIAEHLGVGGAASMHREELESLAQLLASPGVDLLDSLEMVELVMDLEEAWGQGQGGSAGERS